MKQQTILLSVLLGVGSLFAPILPANAGAGGASVSAGSQAGPVAAPARQAYGKRVSSYRGDPPFSDRQIDPNLQRKGRKGKGYYRDVFGYTDGVSGSYGLAPYGGYGLQPRSGPDQNFPYPPPGFAGREPEPYAPPRFLQIDDATSAGLNDPARSASRATYNERGLANVRPGQQSVRVKRTGAPRPLIITGQPGGSSASVGYDPRVTAYNGRPDPFAVQIIRVRVPAP